MIKKKHLLIEAVKNLLDQNNPRLIFIIGKTCTGKSTFAKSLDEQNYKHLELDYIVLESVIKKFKLSNGVKSLEHVDAYVSNMCPAILICGDAF